MLFYPAPQIRRKSDIQAIIRFRLKHINVEHKIRVLETAWSEAIYADSVRWLKCLNRITS